MKKKKTKKDAYAIVSLITGGLALVLSIWTVAEINSNKLGIDFLGTLAVFIINVLVGFPLIIIAIITSILGINSSNKTLEPIGLWLSIIAITLNILVVIMN